MGPLPGSRVHIHSRDPGGWECLDSDPLDLLGSQATVGEVCRPAAGALFWGWDIITAVVANNSLCSPVISQ